MPFVVNFGEERTIVRHPMIKAKLTGVTLDRIVDIPDAKIVRVFVKELPGKPIVLWSDSEYDKAGEYTTSEVLSRIKEVLVSET
jgi:hypothetical protein